MNEKIKKIKQFAEECLSHDTCSAHNMDHVMRVYNLAMKIAEKEKVDKEIIQVAVLLHDIGGPRERNDHTGKVDHAVESAKMAEPFLQQLGFSEKRIRHILDCIITHRYRSKNRPVSVEAKIVFDADKLETVGAIGVARGFVWVGKNNAHIYRKVDIEKYSKENLGGKINGRIKDKTKHSPHLNWETKDKYILKYLYTKKAKALARERLKYLKSFLSKLEREIKGKE
ncbi:HD domain-containing protein [Candidatus Parcubacteria bacterium]|nr:HD domain-containing protein [Candidatus Parcubacteria bacterium]